MNDQAFVRCPQCKRKQQRRGPDAIYWCGHCQAQFDDDDEGIVAGYTNPQKNAEAKEEYELRRKGRGRR